VSSSYAIARALSRLYHSIGTQIAEEARREEKEKNV
jgi:hypothetical protein